jgi:hypothetical protein
LEEDQKVKGANFRDPTRKWRGKASEIQPENGVGGGGKLSKLTKIKLRQNLKSHLGL